MRNIADTIPPDSVATRNGLSRVRCADVTVAPDSPQRAASGPWERLVRPRRNDRGVSPPRLRMPR